MGGMVGTMRGSWLGRRLRSHCITAPTTSACFLLFQKVFQVGFGTFPILIADQLFQTRLHRGRHTFVSWLLPFVAFGTILNDTLGPLVHAWILLL